MPGPGLDLVGAEELAEVAEVIESGHLSRYGPDDETFPAKVRRFEEAVAEQAGVKHALALNSGTSGLYLALTGLGIGPVNEAGMLPATDALLSRSMSFAIGVVDPNLAPFGLRMRDNDETARRRAEQFIEVYREVLA